MKKRIAIVTLSAVMAFSGCVIPVVPAIAATETETSGTIDISDSNDVTFSDIPNQLYTGEAITPDVTVYYQGKPLTEGTDYDVIYHGDFYGITDTDGGKDIGVGFVKIVGKGRFSGTAYLNYWIYPPEQLVEIVSATNVSNEGADVVVRRMDGKIADPSEYTVTVTPQEDGSFDVRVEGKEITVTNSDGETVSWGLGNIWKVVEASPDPSKTDIKDAVFTLDYDTYQYSGTVCCPVFKLTLNGKELVKEKDYNCWYDNNINVGTAGITVRGIGDYTGSATTTFKIVATELKKENVSVENVTETGADVTVSSPADMHTLAAGQDYEVSFKKNADGKTATVTVTGKGGYTGTVTTTVELPKKDSDGKKDDDKKDDGKKPDDDGKKTDDNKKSSDDKKDEGKTDSGRTVEKQVLYRVYNPNSGEHFYTKNKAERDMLVRLGWNNEGTAWNSPKNGIPVYRLYNPNAGDHHYTTSAGEKDTLVRLGWNYEGIGWYAVSKSDKNAVPVYRQYNPNAVAGAHNFTTNKAENDHLVSVGWRGEGIAWYAVK